MRNEVNKLVKIILDILDEENIDIKRELLDELIDKCVEDGLVAELICAFERALVVSSIISKHNKRMLEIAEKAIMDKEAEN